MAGRRYSLVRVTALLGATMTLLVGGIVAVDHLGGGPPSFRRGGEFLGREPTGTPEPGSSPVRGVTSAPDSPPSGRTTRSDALPVPEPPPTPSPRPRATTPAPTGPDVFARAAAGDDPSSRQDRSASAGTVPGAAPAPSPLLPVRPALGRYIYSVDGEEKASMYGSRRFPERMTLGVRTSSDLSPDQLVFDVHYSEDHVERAVVGYRADGVDLDFEGGSIRFGPVRQTSDVDFDPPMPQIPMPPSQGLTRTGTSAARGGDGSVARTEDWRVEVLGNEALTVAGTTVDTWKVQVDRRTAPGSSEQVTVRCTYWYDDERGMWLRFEKTIHGERPGPAFVLTYDAQLTARLVDLSPTAE